MSGRSFRVVACLLMVALMQVPVAQTGAQPGPATGRSTGWRRVSRGSTWTMSTSCLPIEGWTVGSRRGRPMILSLANGTWARQQLPENTGDRGGMLVGVAAISSQDAWAVGTAVAAGLFLHWNGNAWSRTATPAPSTSHEFLRDVANAAPNDIWAVGDAYGRRPTRGLVLHWDRSGLARAGAPRKAVRASGLSGRTFSREPR